MRIIYTTLIILLISLQDVYAQYSPSVNWHEKNKISLDFVGIVWGRLPMTSEYGIIYNRTIAPKAEISAKLAYSGINFFLGGVPLDEGGVLKDSVGVHGISIGSSIQYFLNKAGDYRWFLGLEANYSYSHYFDKKYLSEDEFNLSKLSTSLILGHRFGVFHDELELDVFIGLGAAFRNYYWKKIKSESSNETEDEVINANWSVGWDLTLESSTTFAIPLGCRVGFRF